MTARVFSALLPSEALSTHSPVEKSLSGWRALIEPMRTPSTYRSSVPCPMSIAKPSVVPACM